MNRTNNKNKCIKVQVTMPKTSTERSRECRERKRAYIPEKHLPKSGAQRMREYRARQKAWKAAVAAGGVLWKGETVTNRVAERIDIKGEPVIDIKQEPIVIIKEEPDFAYFETSASTQIIQSSDPLQEDIRTRCEENTYLKSECEQFGNYVSVELQKLSDLNSLAVAKQCIQSVILSAQNGFYKNGIFDSTSANK